MRTFLFLFHVFLATGAVAQDGDRVPRAVDGAEPCPVPADPRWNAAEAHAWQRICAGEVADMSEAPGGEPSAGLDAQDKAAVWPDARRISARFVKQIATRSPYVDAPARPAVRLRYAMVTGYLASRRSGSRRPCGSTTAGCRTGSGSVTRGSTAISASMAAT